VYGDITLDLGVEDVVHRDGVIDEYYLDTQRTEMTLKENDSIIRSWLWPSANLDALYILRIDYHERYEKSRFLPIFFVISLFVAQ
jgi:hypothetical protein